MADSSWLKYAELEQVKAAKASYWQTIIGLSTRQSYGIGDKQLVAVRLAEAKEMFAACGEEIQRREAIEAGDTPRTTRVSYPDFSGGLSL